MALPCRVMDSNLFIYFGSSLLPPAPENLDVENCVLQDAFSWLEIRDLKVGQRSLFLRAHLRHMQITLSLLVCETSPGLSVELQVAPMHLDHLVNVFGDEDHTAQRPSRTP